MCIRDRDRAYGYYIPYSGILFGQENRRQQKDAGQRHHKLQRNGGTLCVQIVEAEQYGSQQHKEQGKTQMREKITLQIQPCGC